MNKKIYIDEVYREYTIAEKDGSYEVRVYKDRKEWRLNGKIHRDNDLPAIEWNDGTKWWIKDGKYHRENGPARMWTGGFKMWYLDGKEYSEQDWKIEVRKKKLEKLLKWNESSI